MKTIQDTTPLFDSACSLLPYEPLEQQLAVLCGLAHFAVFREPGDVMIVRGYAGTGKTTLISALLGAMKRENRKFVVLAPTGRAAKVVANYSGMPASTIHKRIFRGDSVSPDASGTFFLARNPDKDTLFIVDEASMIPDSPYPGLLSQLIRYVYSAPGCNLLFVGDTAQLPPVGQSESPAMKPEYLRSFSLNTYCLELSDIVRQAAKSGILYNATLLRSRMTRGELKMPALVVSKFRDVKAISTADIAEAIADSYSKKGIDNTLVVTRSNYRANAFNRGIRGTVLYAEDELQRDERLVVIKNNYFWSREVDGLGFLANGEIVRVEHVSHTESRYGLNFADVELYLPVADKYLEAKIILNSLSDDAPALSQETLTVFYNKLLQEKIEEGMDATKAAAEIRKDPYYNALQVKYAYCLTCHKAQGGQWKDVYVDLGGIDPSAQQIDFYRWLYTAVTRATSCLYLVNSSIPLR